MKFPKENKLDSWLEKRKKENIIKYTIINVMIKIKLTLINLTNGRF